MAVDLRFIIACIKINADLERVGDQAVNIAERVMDLAANPKAALNVDIPRMASLSISMVVMLSMLFSQEMSTWPAQSWNATT